MEMTVTFLVEVSVKIKTYMSIQHSVEGLQQPHLEHYTVPSLGGIVLTLVSTVVLASWYHSLILFTYFLHSHPDSPQIPQELFVCRYLSHRS